MNRARGARSVARRSAKLRRFVDTSLIPSYITAERFKCANEDAAVMIVAAGPTGFIARVIGRVIAYVTESPCQDMQGA